MAESLGTLTVGVSANVDSAQQAITKLADTLDDFMRKMERGGTGRPPMFQEMNQHVVAYKKHVDEMADAGKAMEDQMAALSRSFKSGSAEGWDASLGRSVGIQEATRRLDMMSTSANRVKYAVLNLGYGVQDAATVFGSSGFAGAIRASANNLTGLGVLMAETKNGLIGLKAALMTPEFAILGIATAVMIASDAWKAYSKSVQDAMDKMTEQRVRDLKPQRAVEEAAREQGLQNELRNMRNIAQVEERRLEIVKQVDVANAKLNAAGNAEIAQRDRVGKIEKTIRDYEQALDERQRGMEFVPGVGAPGQRIRGQGLTRQQRDLIQNVEDIGGINKLRNDLAEAKKQRDEQAKSIPDLARERDNAVKDLKSIQQRATELDPARVKAAKEQLDILQNQLKAVEDIDGAQRKADQALQQRRSTLEQQARQYLAAKERRNDIEMGLVANPDVVDRATTRMYGSAQVLGRGRHPLNLDQFLPGRMRLTDAEKKALREYSGAADELAALPKQAERVIVDKAQVEANQKAITGKIAEILGLYPFLDTKRTLTEQENDMEYRLSYLQRKHQKVAASMRESMKNTPVAALESSTAYEALARSRMQQDPQTDLLQRIVRAEEAATRALEAIREKLDPGRGARIAILERID